MKKVGEVLLFILSGIVKTVSYLMVTLGLWLPTLFTVAFFVSVAVVNASLSSRVMAVFYGGLAFTLAAGIGLAMVYSPSLKKRRAEKKLKEKQKLKAIREATLATEGTEEQAPLPQETAETEPTTYAKENAPVGEATMPAESTMRHAANTPLAEDDYSDLHRKYFSAEPKRAVEQNDMSEEAARLWARLQNADIPDEQPLVFRMRSDENIFVYEYSDRYQYWRRTAAGMRLEHTQYKATADADPLQDARSETVSAKADKTRR